METTRRITKRLSWIWLALPVFGIVGAWCVFSFADLGPKQVVGPTVVVVVPEAGLEFAARVDTGAASTSINARSIHMRDDGMVDYVLLNSVGERVAMRSPLAKTAVVHTGAGSEKRLYVMLTVRYLQHEKQVLANLNDRSALSFPLLLGRNWLKGDYMVDVEGPPTPLEYAAALAMDSTPECPGMH